ncbi:MAG TPA: acyl-CoA dehydrogenase [Polyangiaceae bacterium]|nr:acyl-CoA dehydrogenase [Polyangiaceae bacterium]
MLKRKRKDSPAERLMREPRLAAMAPLIYVAWGDGELSVSEMAALRERLLAAPELGEKEQRELGYWLDSAAPPRAVELDDLLERIRESAKGLETPQRRSLADLGMELARGDNGALSSALAEALGAAEQALGLAGSDAAQVLFDSPFPVRQDFAEAPAAFEPGALTQFLDGPRREAWERVRALLAQDSFRYLDNPGLPEYRAQVLVWLRQVAAAGLPMAAIPKAQGGGGDERSAIAFFEALAQFDLSLTVKFGVQFGLFGGSILQLGTERHHERYLRAAAETKLLGGFAMSELGHGSDVRRIETLARYDRDKQCFVVHTPSESARKEWIGNAACHAQMLTVFAQLEVEGALHGVHALLVPVRDQQGKLLPGVRIEDSGHKMGLNGVDNGRIWFDHVEVPRENLLDRYASVSAEGEYTSPIASTGKRFFTMVGTLVMARLSVAAAAVTASKVGLTIATRYGALRRQFGPEGKPESPLLNFLTHQLRLMPALATTYALHFAMRDLAERYAARTEETRRKVEADTAGLKAYASWHAIAALQQARECCGGMGYLSVNRIADLRRDIDVFATFEGDNTMLMQLVAKSVLTEFRRELSEHAPFSLLRHVRQHVETALKERNPLATRRTGEPHLLDFEFQREAFAYRKHRLTDSVALRLKRRIDEGMSSDAAANEVQDHLLSLSKAHVECLVFESFASAVENCTDEALRPWLERLCQLFALSKLLEDASWYYESGYMEARKARAMRKLVTRLAGELRGQAVPLVEAFGIPASCLSAPIAFPGYLENPAL